MKTGWSNPSGPMAITLLLATIFLSSHVIADGYTIEGELTILKKGGKGPLKLLDNAVVFLDGIETPAPKEPAELGQRNKQFEPRILPVVKGQTVRFYNRDAFDHNVFSTDERNSFDLGRYPRGEYRDRVYNEVGNYKVYCNIHKAMVLDVQVVPNRYFATTDEKGSYRIPDVPAGEYTLKAWHIYGSSAQVPVKVTQDMVAPEMELTSTRIVREIEDHPNKYGEKYEEESFYIY